jgi:hypothetical protein
VDIAFEPGALSRTAAAVAATRLSTIIAKVPQSSGLLIEGQPRLRDGQASILRRWGSARALTVILRGNCR